MTLLIINNYNIFMLLYLRVAPKGSRNNRTDKGQLMNRSHLIKLEQTKFNRDKFTYGNRIAPKESRISNNQLKWEHSMNSMPKIKPKDFRVNSYLIKVEVTLYQILMKIRSQIKWKADKTNWVRRSLLIILGSKVWTWWRWTRSLMILIIRFISYMLLILMLILAKDLNLWLMLEEDASNIKAYR